MKLGWTVKKTNVSKNTEQPCIWDSNGLFCQAGETAVAFVFFFKFHSDHEIVTENECFLLRAATFRHYFYGSSLYAANHKVGWHIGTVAVFLML